MCILDLRENIKQILEAEGVGCATAYNSVNKIMPLVENCLEEAFDKGRQEAEESSKW